MNHTSEEVVLDDDALLRLKQERTMQAMKQWADDWEEEWDRERLAMLRKSGLHAAERLAHLQGAANPKRKTAVKDPSVVGLTRYEYECIRHNVLKSISQSVELDPHLVMTLFRVFRLLGPLDVLVLRGNHCGVQYGRGGFNLNANPHCRHCDGYVLKENCTVKVVDNSGQYYADKTSIESGGKVAQHEILFNFWNWCRTIGTKFQRCAPGTKERGDGLTELLQNTLNGVNSLRAFALAYQTAGAHSNMKEFVFDNLTPTPSTTIVNNAIQPYHAQYCSVLPKDMSVAKCAENLVRQYAAISNDVMTFLQMALGYRPRTSYLQSLLNNSNLPLLTLHPNQLDEAKYRCDGDEDEDYVDGLLKACKKVLRENRFALVKDIQDGDDRDGRMLRYVMNHLDEIIDLYIHSPKAASADLIEEPTDLTVPTVPIMGIHRCMSSNGGIASAASQREKLGDQGFTDKMSKMGSIVGSAKAALPSKFEINLKAILKLRMEPISRPGNFSSKYAGVSRVSLKGGGYKWRVSIELSGRTFPLGRYDNERDAGSVYAGAYLLYNQYMQRLPNENRLLKMASNKGGTK